MLVALAVLTSVLMWVYTWQRLPSESPIKDTKTWNRAAMPLLGVTMFSSYFQQFTVIVSGFFIASADIGIYNVGYRGLLGITLVAAREEQDRQTNRGGKTQSGSRHSGYCHFSVVDSRTRT